MTAPATAEGTASGRGSGGVLQEPPRHSSACGCPPPAWEGPPPQLTAPHVGEALVRHYESTHGRHLLDTDLAGWADLESEALLMTRAGWGASAAEALRRAHGAALVSFLDGAPQHLAQVQVHSAPLSSITISHDQLVTAAALGARCWLYLVFDCHGRRPQLLVLDDPARLTWTPSSSTPGAPGDTAGDARPRWHFTAHDLRRSQRDPAAA